MNEEERNGIDYLKILKETGFNKEKLDAVLNLIDKQQKEIEELEKIREKIKEIKIILDELLEE